jgi:hypothetical protein
MDDSGSGKCRVMIRELRLFFKSDESAGPAVSRESGEWQDSGIYPPGPVNKLYYSGDIQ